MKKKIIIAIIIGGVLVGGTTAVVALNNSKINQKKVSENIKENENTDLKEGDESEEKLDEVKKEEVKEETIEETNENIEEPLVEEEKVTKEDIDNKHVEANKSSEIENEKPKGQTLDEGYQLSYKAWDAYEREDFDEAIRLYEAITNKDALAKVSGEKWRFYTSKDINDKIGEGQRLYDSGKYFDAKIFMSKLMRGNYMMPKQEARAQEIYNNAEARVTEDEVNNLNGNFTFENAVEVLKKEIGSNTSDIYENFQEYTDIHGAKVYQIIVKKNGDPNNSELFVVGSDGSVISGS